MKPPPLLAVSLRPLVQVCSSTPRKQGLSWWIHLCCSRWSWCLELYFPLWRYHWWWDDPLQKMTDGKCLQAAEEELFLKNPWPGSIESSCATKTQLSLLEWFHFYSPSFATEMSQQAGSSHVLSLRSLWWLNRGQQNSQYLSYTGLSLVA